MHSVVLCRAHTTYVQSSEWSGSGSAPWPSTACLPLSHCAYPIKTHVTQEALYFCVCVCVAFYVCGVCICDGSLVSVLIWRKKSLGLWHWAAQPALICLIGSKLWSKNTSSTNPCPHTARDPHYHLNQYHTHTLQEHNKGSGSGGQPHTASAASALNAEWKVDCNARILVWAHLTDTPTVLGCKHLADCRFILVIMNYIQQRMLEFRLQFVMRKVKCWLGSAGGTDN